MNVMGMVGVNVVHGEEELHLFTSEHSASEEMQQMTVKIQAIARGKHGRQEVEQRKTAATMMGAAFRGKAQRDEIRRRDAAVTKVQAMYRGASHREFDSDDYAESHKAAKQKSSRRCYR